MPATSSWPGSFGRIISTAKNRSRHRGRIWTGRSRVDKELRKLMSQELEEIFDKAHLDREKAEVVSLTESNLLDVDRGEVLQLELRIPALACQLA